VRANATIGHSASTSIIPAKQIPREYLGGHIVQRRRHAVGDDHIRRLASADFLPRYSNTSAVANACHCASFHGSCNDAVKAAGIAATTVAVSV
jgi:hypothetical protein